MKKLTSSTSFKTIIIEFVSIVLGVMLALGVNEWRENLNNEDRAEAALNNIENELESNLQTLEYIYNNNKSALEVINSDELDGDSNQTFIPGIQLQEVAWKAITTSGVSNYLDYDIIIQLSSTYTLQEVYKKTAQSFIEANLNLSAYSIALGEKVADENLVKGFKDTFILLSTIESQLLVSYKESLKSLRADNE